MAPAFRRTSASASSSPSIASPLRAKSATAAGLASLWCARSPAAMVARRFAWRQRAEAVASASTCRRRRLFLLFPARGRGNQKEDSVMDFDIPAEIAAYLRELDGFIEREIRPLEREN